MINKKDYTIIALAQIAINAWKQYEKYADELSKELANKGFKKDGWDPEDFVSDSIICDNGITGELFEKEVSEYLYQEISNEDLFIEELKLDLKYQYEKKTN